MHEKYKYMYAYVVSVDGMQIDMQHLLTQRLNDAIIPVQKFSIHIVMQ